MNHQQWLEWRRGGIGSSDAPAIMGVSPWKTRYQTFIEKLYGKSEQKDNSSMKRGREMEETARREFERMMNVSVFPQNIVHKNVPWIRASLDGICMDNKIVVEIKCPNRDDHFRASMHMVPDKYFPQCQHQLLATEMNRMYYFSFYDDEGIVVEVLRDEKYIEKLYEEEKKFWDLVQKRTPPELTEKDFVDMEEHELWKSLAKSWVCANENLKHYEKLADEAKEAMIELSKGRNSSGQGIKMFKSMVEGRIDYKKMMKDFPDLPWDEYRKEYFTKWNIKSI